MSKRGYGEKRGFISSNRSQNAQNVVKESEETLRERQANLALARAELKLAEMTYQRHVDLAKHQAISRQEFDRVKTDVAVKKRG